MVDHKLMEAWFRLVTEAMRGTREAQEAIRSIGEQPKTPDVVSNWMSQFMPGTAVGAQPELFGESLERWYQMMGVVPRSRYHEALEHAEQLRVRLEEAEQTIKQLRSMIGVRGQEEEARKVLNMWEQTVTDTLQAQNAWLRTWTGMDRAETSTEPPQEGKKD